LIEYYKTKIEEELNGLCYRVINLLDQHLIANSKIAEAIVFF